MNLSTLLVSCCPARPCQDALVWLGCRCSLSRAWADCPRGEWLLWLAEQAGVRPTPDWTARNIVAPAYRYAGQALVSAGLPDTLTPWAVRLETGGAAVLSAAEAAARNAAWDAWDAARNAAWAAAEAAAWAAVAAWAAARAAAEAARNAARAAGSAAGAAEHQRCAEAVRVLWPEPPPEVVAMLGVRDD